MADHETWLKKTLADILGADLGLPDYAIDAFRKVGPEDLDELRRNERQAIRQAIKAEAQESRDSRGGGLGEGAGQAARTGGDMDRARRAAKSALEAEPAGTGSERAQALPGDCDCPSATGPNPGQDTRTVGEIGESRKP